MAALRLQRLKEVIKTAYEAGFRGCMDLADQYAEELLANIQAEIQNKDLPMKTNEWRKYTVEELKKKPVGTVFEHIRLGQGWIDGRTEKDKCMTFANGEHRHFMQNIEPWSEIMRELGNL